MSVYRICILTLLFAVSCQSRQSELFLPLTERTSVIQVPDEFNELSALDSIVASYRIIPLDCDPSSPSSLGEITGILKLKDSFILWDTHQRKIVNSYDTDGHYLFSFGRLGRGPGEFIQPDDVTVSDSSVVILDNNGNCLLFYDLKGEYNHTVSFRPYLIEVAAMGDGLFIAQGVYNTQDSLAHKELFVIDQNGDVIRTMFKNKYTMNYSRESDISDCNGHIFYNKPFRSRIISFDENLQPFVRYYLDFGDDTLPESFEKDCSGDYSSFMKHYEEVYSYFLGGFFDSDRFAGFEVVKKGQWRHPYLCIYDKNSGKCVSFPRGLTYLNDKLDMNSYLVNALLSLTTLCVRDNIAYCVTEAPVYEYTENIEPGYAVVAIEFRK